jgi:hypothetical protein
MQNKLLKLSVFILLAAAAARPVRAQQTQVTGCIVDPNSIPYAGGQILITIAPAGGPAPTVNGKGIQGTFGPTPLDSGGCFQQALWPNAQISPGGTQWNFAVTNPGAAPPVGFGPVQVPAGGGGVNITIAGGTQNVGSTLSAVAPKLFNDSSGGSSVSITATSPIVVTPSPLTGTGVISCPTCTVGGGGFGFATGAIVANSTGNTPANGFTLSDGANTAAFSPIEITLANPSNPGVIDLNSNTSPAITVGDQDTIGTSTQSSRITPTIIQTSNVSAGSSASLGDSGTATVIDASGNQGELGSPNGAGLTLNGPAGISIVCDGTVPSCNWDDGAGDQSTIGTLVGLRVNFSNGGIGANIAVQDTNNTNGAEGVSALAQETDGTGSASVMLGAGGQAILLGTNVAGDIAIGVKGEADNTGTGAAAEISGGVFSEACTAATILCTSVHILGNTGGAQGVSTVGLLIDPQAAGIAAIKTGTGIIVFGDHIDQLAANTFAGTCAMVAGTSCTWTLATAFTGTPVCVATAQGTNTTGVGDACSVSGTTVTITAAVANSNTWGAVVIGNPN